MKSLLLSLAVMLAILTSHAQDDGQTDDIGALITDRPDATESPSLVRKNFLQIETGGLYSSFDDGAQDAENIVYNTTLLRYGLLGNFELRIGLDFGESRNRFRPVNREISDTGFSPLLLGGKIGIAKGDGWNPKIALMGHITLPFTANDAFKPENTGMDFRFAFDHTINDRSGVAWNVGAAIGDDSAELAYLYTLSYGIDLTSSLGFYAEVYGFLPEDSSADHLWDAGFTYLANDDLQFDVTVGSGITDTQDILLSAGLSYRIRNMWGK